ncbi:dockerin type I domain-containing protein [Carnobacterium gallinarum]|uniref:dockerin type I domain-containing protein n=1 Tax=Carnobacterium gallinarum TaxID=2749 RepID=UPI0005594955|nr:dockerin type I domain-containing protein [Carnobacterium gallinarum]
MKNNKLKKAVTIGLLSTTLFSNMLFVPAINKVAYAEGNVSTTKVAESVTVGNVVITPDSKVIDLKNTNGTMINLDLNWLKESKVDVLQLDLTFTNGTIVATSLDRSSVNIKEGGKKARILLDQRLGSIQLYIKGDSQTVNNSNVTMSMILGYSGEANGYTESKNNYSTDLQIVDVMLEKAKEENKVTVNNLPNLTNEDKTGFDQQIDEAKTIEVIQQIVENAKVKDRENVLEQAKETGKATINSLPNLSDIEKNGFNQQIDGAKTVEEVQQIVETAKVKSATNVLDQVKEAGKATINSLPTLTDAEKAGFNQQIDGAKTVGEVQQIIETAKTKSTTNVLDQVKEAGKVTINSLPTLTDAEKAGFNQQIDGVKTVEEVQQIIETAKTKSTTNALEQAKEAGKATINKLPTLTDAEKAGVNQQIDEAKTAEEIQQIVETAKIKSATNALEQAKEAGKATINKLSALSDAEKTEFNKQIDGAQTVEEVQQIVEEAKSKDTEKALEQAKIDGKNTINAFENLTDREKNNFNQQIDEAKNLEKIQQIVDEAKQKNAEFLLGDVNNDGYVNFVDAALLKAYIVMEQFPNNIEDKERFMKAIDLNKDTTINIRDYAQLKALLV